MPSSDHHLKALNLKIKEKKRGGRSKSQVLLRKLPSSPESCTRLSSLPKERVLPFLFGSIKCGSLPSAVS